MKIELSDESKLLIKNWSIVREIHKAEGELAIQLCDFLFALESDMTQCSWWDDTWLFKCEPDTDMYIARHIWKRTDGFAVLIGVEDFSVESIFGTEGFASLYVWVAGNRSELVSDLRNHLRSQTEIVGDIETNSNSSYVVRQTLRKCLPEEMDRFDEIVGVPMLDFFSCYGKRGEELTTVLESFEKKTIQQEN